MAGKYTPLEQYLKGIPNETGDVTMNFAQIERIINDKLPRSSHLYRPWWANEKDGRHVHAHAWLNAGWVVDTVSQREKWVRFRRE